MPKKTINSEDIILDETSSDSPEEKLIAENEAAKSHIATLTEEMNRLKKVVDSLAKKNNVSTGEAKRDFEDGVAYISYTQDGKRIVDFHRTAESFVEVIGENVVDNQFYKITYEKDGIMEDKVVPYRNFKDILANAKKVPVLLPNFLKRVRQGDHYVNMSVRALQGQPYKQEDDISVVVGRYLPDGETKVYDGETKIVKFGSLNL